MSAWRRIVEGISRAWLWCRDLWAVLTLFRFAVWTLIIGAGLLLVFRDGQGQEALRALADTQSHLALAGRWSVFLGATILWALNAWYCCRALTYVHLPGQLPESPRVRRIERILPRAIGTAAILIVALSLYRAASAFDAGQPERWELRIAAYGFAVIAALFYGFTVVRRKAIGDAGAREKTSLANLPPKTRATIALFLVVGLAAFLAFVFAPQRAGPGLGAHTIFLFFAGTWIPFGTVLVYVGARYRLPPMLTTLLVLAVLFSAVNDNHAIRTDRRGAAPGAPPKSLRDQAHAWIALREKGNPKVLPAFFVAAEGGGIRAAYWSAAVLSALDEIPGFSWHVFAMSGVSGGSLGEAVYAGLLAERQAPGDGSCVVREPRLLDCARGMLGQDYLSPALGVMLFPDLLQRFLFFPVPAFDRARALEASWEKGWRDRIGGNRFARPFDELWSGNGAQWVPSLFLNSTSAETGKRVLLANVRVSEPQFADAADLREMLGAPVPLSTAVHNSARFTYVSPAGRMVNAGSGRTIGHLVDGGYFENSGTATLMEVLNGFTEALREPVIRDRATRVRPVVLVIINDPEQRPDAQAAEPYRFLGEVLSPVRALLHTRDARGSQARAVIHNTVTDPEHHGCYLEVRLRHGAKPLPLGWMLSESAKEEIDGQLQSLRRDAGGVFEVVKRLMTSGGKC